VGDGVEHAVEGGAGDAEDFGGAEFVAVAGEEDCLDLLADDLVEADESSFGGRGAGGGSGERGEGGVEVGGGEVRRSVVEEELECGLQVVEVTGPGLGGGSGEEGGVEGGWSEAQRGGEVIEEEVNQVRDVIVAFAQGRDFDLERAEGVGEVGGEGAGADEGAEAAFGEGDEAWGLRSAFAEEAKEGGLGGGGEAIGLGEVEHAFVEGGRRGVVGEAEFGVVSAKSEERAVDERGELMEGAGDGFLAGAGFTGEKSGAEVGSDALYAGPEDGHGGAGAEQHLRGCEEICDRLRRLAGAVRRGLAERIHGEFIGDVGLEMRGRGTRWY
jgi:hypothetical protein